MTSPNHPAGNHLEPRVWWSFIVIVLGFVLVAIVSIYAMRSSQDQVRMITKHAAIDIELVSKLSRDLDRKRVLMEDHISEKNDKDMGRIESQLADIDTEIAATTNSYELAGQHRDELAAWQQLDTEIASLEPQFHSVLALSGRNRDAEAKDASKGLEARFDQIDQTINRLLSLNHARANHEAAEVRVLQWRAAIVLAVLTLLWTLFSIFTARWVIRVISQYHDQMNRAMGRLEEQNRELDAFAGRVAHDLRGPLTAINLAASQFPQGTEYERAAGGVLRRGVARMEAIIQDLLTLSGIGAQTMGAACQVAAVVADVQEDLMPEVKAANGVLEIDTVDATVPCHHGLLRQVLWNLGVNAVRYRRPEIPLKLDVHGHNTSDGFNLIVSDNGIGMSPSVARRAFEPFFRAHETASTPGTGLGLSIVKRVIEASGGTVSIDSEPGRGTTVKIHLPRTVNKAAA